MTKQEIVDRIVNWTKRYFVENGPDCKAVIGISGGKDSTVTAALLCRALGPDRVVAVKMPQGEQHDIDMANKVIEYLGIKESYEVNISPACEATYQSLPEGMRDYSAVYTNTPARERMKVLYAIAAAVHGRVANTCNRSEDYVGYATKFGDSAGDFSLLTHYTVREVKEIGRTLGLPEEFIEKIPEDGLSGLTDEENFGFSYETLDAFLLDGVVPDYETYRKIRMMHERNTHKVRSMPVCHYYTENTFNS